MNNITKNINGFSFIIEQTMENILIISCYKDIPGRRVEDRSRIEIFRLLLPEKYSEGNFSVLAPEIRFNLFDNLAVYSIYKVKNQEWKQNYKYLRELFFPENLIQKLTNSKDKLLQTAIDKKDSFYKNITKETFFINNQLDRDLFGEFVLAFYDNQIGDCDFIGDINNIEKNTVTLEISRYPKKDQNDFGFLIISLTPYIKDFQDQDHLLIKIAYKVGSNTDLDVIKTTYFTDTAREEALQLVNTYTVPKLQDIIENLEREIITIQ